MFERFTGESRQVVVLAQELARDLTHHHIGTEHLLLALLAQESSPVRRGLVGLGLTPEAARALVLDAVPREQTPPPGHIPFTPRAKKALELSLREALARNDQHIGPEHLLLGILAEGGGVAARILLLDGRTADRIRQVAAPPGRPGAPGPMRTPAAEEALARAEQLAAGAPVGSHHLLEALALTGSSAAGRVLSELGVTGDALSAGIDAVDLADTSDTTPEQRAAAGTTWTVDGGTAVLTTTDPDTVAELAALVEQTGGPLTGEGVLAGPFIAVHGVLRAALASIAAELNPPEPPSGAPRTPSLLDRLRRRRPS
jgi:ATP-dependent Clp protease ATP-binding subunit ClpA